MPRHPIEGMMTKMATTTSTLLGFGDNRRKRQKRDRRQPFLHQLMTGEEILDIKQTYIVGAE